jgi:hypothetical protein
MRHARVAGVWALFVCSGAMSAQELRNWAAPPSWRPPSAQTAGRTALQDFAPFPFIPLTPCRLVDTRGNAPLTGGFLPAATVRNYTLTGVCNLPTTALAVSLNATVVHPTGPGFLTLYPQGGVFPPVSTLNYLGGDVIVNAAVVPLSPSGGISMALGVSGGDVILDVNGYYGPTSTDPTQFLTLTTTSQLYTLRLMNLSTTCGGACGLYQTVASGWAIEGVSANSMGVQGVTQSSSVFDVAGVHGKDAVGAGFPSGFLSAGVMGEGRDGVIGISNTGGGSGVYGQAFTPGSYGVWGTTNSTGGYGVLGQANFSATFGVYAQGNLGASGTKPFVEPHPTDASKEIRYVALEGPEAGTYFRGTATTVDHQAVIDVPETFRIVTAEEGLTVHLTPVGALAQVAVISRDLNQIVVASSRDVTFDYIVHGVRRAYRDWQVVADSVDVRPTSPDQKLPSYLSEEAKRRLVANGTYNADGTVNLTTAERMGWAQVWRDQAAATAAAATAGVSAQKP